MQRMDSNQCLIMLKTVIKKIVPAHLLVLVGKFKVRNNHIGGVPPVVFNKNGEKMIFAYLSSPGAEQHIYSLTDGRLPTKIVWDRINNQLPKQFYVNHAILDIDETSKSEVYLILLESESIIPSVYKLLSEKADYFMNHSRYIFTHSKSILSAFPNARFCPAYSVWYGTEKWGGDASQSKLKTKMVSFVGCNKSIATMHFFRQEVTKHYVNSCNVDVLGKAVGRFASCDEIYTKYRYNIAIENSRYDFYFTEKILNCFASRTVPIYYGCPSIGDFFNIDGIIVLEEPTIEALDSALASCCIDDYKKREKAIEDNFRRVQEFLCVEDYLCAQYPEILC